MTGFSPELAEELRELGRAINHYSGPWSGLKSQWAKVAQLLDDYHTNEASQMATVHFVLSEQPKFGESNLTLVGEKATVTIDLNTGSVAVSEDMDEAAMAFWVAVVRASAHARAKALKE